MVSIERIDGHRRLVVSRAIDAPVETVWTLLTDTERWPEWGPSVRAVESSERVITSGTRGRVQLPFGAWIPFRITTCEPYRWQWEIARIPATGHRVDQIAEGQSRVSFDMPLPAVAYAPVCRRALDRIASLAVA